MLDGLAAAFGYRRPSSSAATSRRLRFGAGVAAAAANEQEAAAAEALLRTAKAQKLSAEDAAEARQAAELAQKLQLAVVQLAAVARSQPAGVPLDASRCSELSSVLSLLQEVLQHGLLPPPATAIASVRDDGDRAFRALLLAEQLMMATAGGGGSGGGVTGGGAGGASATSSPRRVQLGLVGIQVAASRGADGSGKLHAWLLSTLSQHLLAPRLALLYQSRGVLSRWYGPGALLQQEEPLKQLVAAAVQLGSVDVAAAVVAAAAAGASSREEEPAAGRPGACETRAAAAAVEQVRDRQQPTAAAALLPSVAPATAAAPAAAAAVPVFHWPTSADPVAAPATAVGRIAEGPASNAASPLDARTSAAGVSAAAAPPAAYSLSPLSPSDLEVAASQYS